MGQDVTVLEWLDELGISPLCLGSTRDGHPRHPLYLPKDAELGPFPGRQASAAGPGAV
jgi:hypothetical protein